MKNTHKLRWIEAVLANDEDSTDEELVEHFVGEGGMPESEAREWVNRRDEYLSMACTREIREQNKPASGY